MSQKNMTEMQSLILHRVQLGLQSIWNSCAMKPVACVYLMAKGRCFAHVWRPCYLAFPSKGWIPIEPHQALLPCNPSFFFLRAHRHTPMHTGTRILLWQIHTYSPFTSRSVRTTNRAIANHSEFQHQILQPQNLSMEATRMFGCKSSSKEEASYEWITFDPAFGEQSCIQGAPQKRGRKQDDKNMVALNSDNVYAPHTTYVQVLLAWQLWLPQRILGIVVS